MLNVHLLVLSVVIATLYASIFHLLWSAMLKDWIIYWIAALLGFGAGQLLATVLAWHEVARIGELHLLPASASCWLFMAFARRLRL